MDSLSNTAPRTASLYEWEETLATTIWSSVKSDTVNSLNRVNNIMSNAFDSLFLDGGIALKLEVIENLLLFINSRLDISSDRVDFVLFWWKNLKDFLKNNLSSQNKNSVFDWIIIILIAYIIFCLWGGEEKYIIDLLDTHIKDSKMKEKVIAEINSFKNTSSSEMTKRGNILK